MLGIVVGGLGEDNWGGEQCSELVSKLSPSIVCLRTGHGSAQEMW